MVLQKKMMLIVSTLLCNFHVGLPSSGMRRFTVVLKGPMPMLVHAATLQS